MCLVVTDVHVIPSLVSILSSDLVKFRDIPMVLSNIASILHGTPGSPRLDSVLARVPDLLAPDNIFQIQRGAVVHNPLSDLPSGDGWRLWHCISDRLSASEI